MNVVIELDTYSLKYENVLAVGRALVDKGDDVKMWNPTATAFLDMVYELKPDIIFYTSDRTVPERARDVVKSERPDVLFVNTIKYENLTVADTLAFRKLNKHETFAGQICLLQYPEIEDVNNIVLKQKMSVKNGERFRLFSIEKTSGAKYCGWLPKELHPLIFSSADSILALSQQTAVNALLCNDNVKIVENGTIKQFTMSEQELVAISNERIAQAYRNC